MEEEEAGYRSHRLPRSSSHSWQEQGEVPSSEERLQVAVEVVYSLLASAEVEAAELG